MRRPVFLLSVIQLLLSFFMISISVHADSPGTKKSPHHFLPVHQAFQFSGTLKDNKATIHVRIADGYYLYRDRLHFHAINTKTRVGDPLYPAGIEILDPFQNQKMTVLPESSDIVIPYESSQPEAMLEISFQGCARAGLCYPPSEAIIQLYDVIKDGKTPFSGAKVNFASSDRMNVPVVQNSSLTMKSSAIHPSENHNQYLGLLQNQHNLLMLIGLFLLAGILLAFTPCVLPMIPILSATLASGSGNRRRTIFMTIAYVFCMSLTYAIAGVLVGMFGATVNLQAFFQSAWVIGLFSLLFLVLALSMFGFFELQLPERLRRLVMSADERNSEKRKGSLIGAGFMGVCSALIVSPCITAPLVGALLYISSTQNALLGGLALFSLGLGMGIPLFAVGIGLGHWLPERGVWMNKVRHAFGILMIAISLWLISRVLPDPIVLISWGAFVLSLSLYLFFIIDWSKTQELYRRFIPAFAGLLLLIYGTALVTGGLKGNASLTEPLGSQAPAILHGEIQQNRVHFTKVTSPDTAYKLLKESASSHQPAILDFAADWCETCKKMEKNVFADPEVKQILSKFTLIRFDITKSDSQKSKMMDSMSVFGTPTLIFYGRDGSERVRREGELNKQEFIQLANKVLHPYQNAHPDG